MINKIIEGDNRITLKSIPDGIADMCVTSPSYYGLRDYGHDNQIGLEETPEQFVEQLVQVFREVKRILKDDGTLWLNLGDSYATGTSSMRKQGNKGLGLSKATAAARDINRIPNPEGMKTKDLIGIPWMVAFALRADGWYLRQDIIWQKPNPMPESVTDRCTKAHEYIFLLSKSKQYYYDADAIKEACLTNDNSNRDRDNTKLNNTPGRAKMKGLKTNNYEKANKRSVWSVSTKPFSGAHFATFPEELITDCIKAGCPENGIVLDPFGGAGTTAVVARKLNRNYLLCELNPNYIKIAENRLIQELGLFI